MTGKLCYLLLLTLFPSFVLAGVKIEQQGTVRNITTDTSYKSYKDFCGNCIFNQNDLFARLFARIDINDDMLISRAEYLLHQEELFNYRDLDYNGVLNENEFNSRNNASTSVTYRARKSVIARDVMENLYALKLRRSDKTKIFSPIDKNRDGMISYSEYREYAYHNFLRLDADLDRNLSLKEFTKAYFSISFKLHHNKTDKKQKRGV